MRKKLLTLALCSTITLLSIAQYDPEALAVLDAMSAKYQNIEAFKAAFSQRIVNENAGIDESMAGDVTIKDTKFLLEISGQQIFNDGENVYNYNKDIGEVTISKYEPDGEEIAMSNIYELYKKGFKYILMATQANGDRVVELDPEDRDKSYYKIQMTISAKDELKGFTVYEKSGNQYFYSINSLKKVSVNDSFFTFDSTKYPDVEVLDFR